MPFRRNPERNNSTGNQANSQAQSGSAFYAYRFYIQTSTGGPEASEGLAKLQNLDVNKRRIWEAVLRRFSRESTSSLGPQKGSNAHRHDDVAIP